MGSAEFAEKMLDVGVVCTPGTGFGPTVDGFVRFAVTKPVDKIREALSRMEKLF
jgi:LL-diaminopimelate aminotransferase